MRQSRCFIVLLLVSLFSCIHDNQDETNFDPTKIKTTVVPPTPPVVGPVLISLSSNITLYCSLNDGSNNSTAATVDGTTYVIRLASAAQQAKVDFVYLYKGMYSPSAYASKTFTVTTSSWTTKNATTFAKTTSIVYANATYIDVKVAADAATVTSILNLVANDVVVFKTSAGKVGVFKVVSITSGYSAQDNIVISVKIQQ